MCANYNINQTVLKLSTTYVPEKRYVAHFINNLVESLKIKTPYIFGRPKEYDLGMLLKLLLFTYTRNIYTSRKIEQFAQENLPARRLTQEHIPSYRTIIRFRDSDEIKPFITQFFEQMTTFLREHKLIEDTLFIDDTKILADANKYSFISKKNTIRYAELNKEKIHDLLKELKHVFRYGKIPESYKLNSGYLEEIIGRLEVRLEDIEKSEKDNDDKYLKEVKRYLKMSKKELTNRLSKFKQYEEQTTILKDRNSYSKTDNVATFMRVKVDYMKNGQLKPAYNLQLATSNQFIIACELFQNPTDTRTLIPFLEKIHTDKARQLTIVADSGYGFESNYECIANQDNLIGIIPYNKMLKEKSKKWCTDDSKVMNWSYNEISDVYTDHLGVHFSFHRYIDHQDNYRFIRQFKEYRSETTDKYGVIISAALTKSGHIRKITVNPN